MEMKVKRMTDKTTTSYDNQRLESKNDCSI